MNRLKFINVWLTYECNYVCTYCYERDITTSSHMNEYTASKFVEFVKTYYDRTAELCVNFHGGEPLLNYGVLKYIIEELKKTNPNIIFGLTTNGSLLDEESIVFLSENCTYNLSISIDGLENSHHLNRKSKNGVNEYDKIMLNAIKLKHNSKSLRIRMTINKMTIDKIYENIKYLYDKGFDLIAPALDFTESKWSEDEYQLIKDQFEKVKIYEKEICINDGIYWANPIFKELSKCHVGDSYFNIAPDGTFYPCTFVCGEKELRIGSLDIGFDQNKIKRINEISSRVVNDCVGCSAYNCCTTTRCKLMNYSLTKDYFAPCESVCTIMRVKGAM